MMKRINAKKLTALVTLTLMMGWSLPVYAEPIETDSIQGQQLTKGDWKPDKIIYAKDSTITVDSIAIGSRSLPRSAQWDGYAPLTLENSTLKAKKGISVDHIDLGSTYKNHLSGVYMLASHVQAPVLAISHIGTTEDNRDRYIWGLDAGAQTDYGTGTIYHPRFNVDTIHIDTVSTDNATQAVGAAMEYVQWQPQTAGAKNNLIIENITNRNTTEPSLAVGVINAVSDDAPLIITGDTVLKNISALHGSAVGFYTEGAQNLKEYTRFHQLDISGIHGTDLSIGNFGGSGSEYVENATIDMTGGTGYTGSYTASAEDRKQEAVNQFAIIV